MAIREMIDEIGGITGESPSRPKEDRCLDMESAINHIQHHVYELKSFVDSLDGLEQEKGDIESQKPMITFTTLWHGAPIRLNEISEQISKLNDRLKDIIIG